MSINLIENIQANLHYPPLQKIDPNTQEVVVDESKPDEHRFSQAAIPAVLTALCKYSTTDTGAENMLRGGSSTDWASLIFADTKNEVIQKVASYSFQSGEYAGTQMNVIAIEAGRLLQENLPHGATIMDVKNFMSAQRHTILQYLPAALQMGAVLDDTTLDDNTNKMEGPISGLVHKIGEAFSNPT